MNSSFFVLTVLLAVISCSFVQSSPIPSGPPTGNGGLLNSGNGNSGILNSGNGNSGILNSGNGNSGILNSGGSAPGCGNTGDQGTLNVAKDSDFKVL